MATERKYFPVQNYDPYAAVKELTLEDENSQLHELIKGKNEALKMMATALKNSDDRCSVLQREAELRTEQIRGIQTEFNETETRLIKTQNRLKQFQDTASREIDGLHTKVGMMEAEVQRFRRLNDDLIGKLKATLDDIEKPAVSTKHSLMKDITKAKMVAKLHETSAKSFLKCVNHFAGTTQEYVPGMTLGIDKQTPIVPLVETKKDDSSDERTF
jgi:chromosome segregation ATPase